MTEPDVGMPSATLNILNIMQKPYLMSIGILTGVKWWLDMPKRDIKYCKYSDLRVTNILQVDNEMVDVLSAFP